MSSPVRILCAGAGHMGRSHALAYHQLDGFEIVGLCTRSAASREALNRELGGTYAEYGDFLAALAETRPDAVSISTYPDTHAPYARAALEAGCHVFTEKPIADSVAAAEDLVALARAAGKRVHVLHVTTGEEMAFLADQKDVATVETSPTEAVTRVADRSTLIRSLRSSP